MVILYAFFVVKCFVRGRGEFIPKKRNKFMSWVRDPLLRLTIHCNDEWLFDQLIVDISAFKNFLHRSHIPRRCCWPSPPFVACWVSTVRCRCQKTLGLGDYSPDSHLSGTFSKGKRAGCQNIGTSALILTQNMHRDSLSLLDTKIFWQFYQDWHAHDQFYHWQTKWTIRCTALLQTDV